MKKENKILIKYFILVFAISALIINWREISPFFNYRVIFHFVSEIFQSASAAKTATFIPDIPNENFIPLENSRPEKSPIPKEFESSEKENGLQIPKLNVWAPLVFSVGSSKKDIATALNKGVVHFPASVLPGKEGETVILGHSSAAGRPKIKYDWVFSRLNELTSGDEIIVYFSGRKYKYLVSEKFFLKKGETLPRLSDNSGNTLSLISCWPPGKDTKRIVIRAK